MARSAYEHHDPPPPDVIATRQEWLSVRLNAELDVLSNLIYLARHEPDQCEQYLKVAEEIVARIRLRLQNCHSFKAA